MPCLTRSCGVGWQAELQRREQLFPYLRAALQRFADDHGDIPVTCSDQDGRHPAKLASCKDVIAHCRYVNSMA